MSEKLVHLLARGAALCIVLASSANAHAEPNAEKTDTPAAGAPATPEPSPEAVKEAGSHYTRGLSLYGDGEFVLALVEFERAYQLSQNYKVLYNIGQVRIQLGRYAKGREALEEYLQRGGSNINADRTQAVNKDLAMLAERTASLRIVANEDGADIALDGKNVGTSPLSAPLVVDAGEHSLVLHKAGFYDRSQSVTLAGRDQIDVKLDLAPVVEAAPQQVIVERHSDHPVATRPSHTGMWVGWAATGTLAVSAGVIGYFGISKANDLESMRKEYGVTAGQLSNTKSSASTLLTISDVTAGLAAVAGAVSLYLTVSASKEHPAAEPKPAGGSPSVALGIGPGGLRLRGAF